MKNAQRAANHLLMARHNVRSMAIMTDKLRVTSKPTQASAGKMTARSLILNQPSVRQYSSDAGKEDKVDKEAAAAQEEQPTEEAQQKATAEPAEQVQAQEAEKAATELEQAKNKVIKEKRKQDAASSPAQDYADRTRLEDQKRYMSEALAVGEQAVAYAKIDVEQYKERTLAEMDREKAAYIGMLDAQEKAILEDAERRIFAKIDEGPEADALTQQREYLNEQIAKKRQPASVKLMLKAKELSQETAEAGSKSQAEVSHEQDMRRKEILVKQSQLKPQMNIKELLNAVPRFEQLDEAAKRAVYVSLNVGFAQQQAKMALAKADIGDAAALADFEKQSALYSSLLKAVLPKDFKGEFDSIKEIQQRREEAGKMFDTGKEAFLTACEQLGASQEKLKDFAQNMNVRDLAKADAAKYAMVLDGKQGLIPSQQFSELAEKVSDLKQVVSELQAAQEPVISEQDREREFSSQVAQSEAERDAQQKLNLLQLALGLKSDLTQQLKKHQTLSAERASSGKDMKPDDIITVDPSKLQTDEVSFAERRSELLATLKRYKVDPEWLRGQQTKQLTEHMNKEGAKLMAQAEALEKELLLSEQGNLSKMFSRSADSRELKEYLLNSLRSGSVVERLTQVAGSNTSLLTDALIANLQSSLEPGAAPFDMSKFLAEKLKQIQSEKKVPISKSDGKLTYHQYKLQQLDALERQLKEGTTSLGAEGKSYDLHGNPARSNAADPSVVDNSMFLKMSEAKKKAWFAIYNDYLQSKWSQQQKTDYMPTRADQVDSKGRVKPVELPNEEYFSQVETQSDFYDLFKDWEIRAMQETSGVTEKVAPNFFKMVDFMQKRAIAERHVPFIGREAAYEMYGCAEVNEPDTAAAFTEVNAMMIRDQAVASLTREDEIEEGFSDQEMDVAMPRYEKFERRKEIQAVMDEMSELQARVEQETGAEHMLDRSKVSEADADHYVALFSELEHLKREFKADYGIAAENFNPVKFANNIAWRPDGSDTYNKIIDFGKSGVPFFKNYEFVESKIREAYLAQFPDDADMMLLDANLPKLQLSAEAQDEIARNRYDERLQEKYVKLLNEEGKEVLPAEVQFQMSVLEQAAKEADMIPTPGMITVSDRVSTEEIDNELLTRIKLHLNERHERDIKISEGFTDVLPSAAPYDMKAFEQSKRDAKFDQLSDYEKQRELLFRMKAHQATIKERLIERNAQLRTIREFEEGSHFSAYNQRTEEARQQAKDNEVQKRIVELMTPREDRPNYRSELGRIRTILKKKQEAVKKAWLKEEDGDVSKEPNDIPIHRRHENGFLTEESKELLDDSKLAELERDMLAASMPFARTEQEAQAIVLEEERAQQKDAHSQVIQDGLKHRKTLQKEAPLNKSDPLSTYAEVDHFGSAKHREGSSGLLPRTESLLDAAGALNRKGLSIEEEEMALLASTYSEFNIEVFRDNMLNRNKLFMGADLGRPSDDVAAAYSAESSSEIIKAAQEQDLTSDEARLSLLYDNVSPARQNYLRAKYQMFVNRQLRIDFAEKVLSTKQALTNLKQEREAFYNKAHQKVKQYCSDVVPRRVHNFIKGGGENTTKPTSTLKINDMIERMQKFDPTSNDVKNYNDELRLQLAILGAQKNKQAQVQSQVDFISQQMKENQVAHDPQTESLLFQLNLGLGKLERANQNLRNVLKTPSATQYTQIEAGNLEKFFETSLQSDNFEGLASLINYLEANAVDISQWDMTRFRSALDFYLNHSFNMNNVLTFTRFYAHHVRSALSQPNLSDVNFKEVDAAALASAHQEVFGQVEGIVDIGALFADLVARTGSQTLLDPISKKDPLADLVELFAREDVAALSMLSEHGSTFLADEDVCRYYANRFDQPNSFRRMMSQALRAPESTVESMIHSVKGYQGRNGGKLPSSFSEENVKKAYLTAKAQANNDEQKLSVKQAELFLFLFKSLDMLPESIDLCSNFDQVVAAGDGSEVRNYYMAEALLKAPIGNEHYNSVMKKAVFEDASESNSLAYVNSMTKAYLKDGNAKHALTFFEEQIQKRRQAKEAQEVMYLKLYDETFQNAQSTEDVKITLQELVKAREQLRQESVMVKKLEGILARCDSTEIDALFQLQAVLREESQILKSLSADGQDIQDKFIECAGDQRKLTAMLTDVAAPNLKSLQELDVTFNPHQIEAIDQVKDDAAFQKQVKEGINARKAELQPFAQAEQKRVKKLAKELSQIQSRKATLEQKLQHSSREDLLSLLKDAGENGKVSLLGNVQNVDAALQTLGVSSSAERDALAKYREDRAEIDAAVLSVNINDQHEMMNKAIMETFRQAVASKTTERLTALRDLIESEIYDEDKLPLTQTDLERFENLLGVESQEIEDLINLALFNPSGADDPFDQNIISHYKKFLEKELPTGDRDELTVRLNVHESVVNNYSEQLNQVLDNRRERVLPYAIATFNKIQGKQMPLWMREAGELNAERNEDGVQKSTIVGKENIELTKKIRQDQQLNDSRVQKHIQGDKMTTSKNVFEKEQTIAYLNSNSKVADPSLINETIERYDYLLTNDQSPVISNFDHLLDYNDGSDIMPFTEFRESENSGLLLKKYMTHANKMMTLCDELDKMRAVISDMGNHIQGHGAELDHELTRTLQARQEVEQRRVEGASDALGKAAQQLHAQLGDDLSNEQKISFMKKALAMSGYDSMEVYNQFYAEDLIQFGMRSDSVEAVRLGERMMVELGATSSVELGKAVKQWKLKNGAAYTQAHSQTGPVNSATVYRKYNNDPSRDSYQRNVGTIVNIDDPYWREFAERNYRHSDRYKWPSALAWDHDEHGLLGQVVDMKDIARKQAEMDRYL